MFVVNPRFGVRVPSGRRKNILKTYKFLDACPYTGEKGCGYPSTCRTTTNWADNMESSFVDLSFRHSDMSILTSVHYMFEAAENKMEQSRRLRRHAEEACKAINNLTAALDEYGISKEARLMQSLIKKLDFVLEKRSEELSRVTDNYLSMEKYLRNLTSQVISEIGKGSYGPVIQNGSISI